METSSGREAVREPDAQEDAQKGREKAKEACQANASAAYADLAPMVAELRAERLSLRAIADRLNAEGHTTRREKAWSQVQVKRVLDRTGT